ncbi:hypothetical protein RM545_03485 [Zunongwangia sp. F260]|uniref:J domain-containing protein n=1 Tax=Autumnicola lenta TaxID=3075593 RepID=A0ABU3CHA6_9FLAO|nr:hypothetical protein [Zunongwangia sp. F260]MDT0645741.1 hypothetical protein [Zunongwangia sp. F260]
MASNTQTSLFDTYENVQLPSSTDIIKSLNIKAKPGEDPGLSKLKHNFNHRLKGIAKLKDEIEKLPKVFAMLNENFSKIVKPTEESLVKSKLELIETMDSAFNKKSFSESQREYIRSLMLRELNSISEMGYEYDEKYEKYFEMDMLEMSEGSTEFFQEMVNDMMGIDVDIEDILGEKKLSPEAFEEKYGKEINEKAKAFKEEQENQKQQPKSRQTATKELGEPDLNLHFMKTYKNIAKRIHPDLEQNATIRKEKEKLMQELASAKDDLDLFQLISIKLKVEQIENKEVVLDEAYLKLYAERLLEQKKNLETDIFVMKKQSGRNSWLYQNFHAQHATTTRKRLEAFQKELLSENDYYKELNKSLKTVKGMKEHIRAERKVDDSMFQDIFDVNY